MSAVHGEDGSSTVDEWGHWREWCRWRLSALLEFDRTRVADRDRANDRLAAELRRRPISWRELRNIADMHVQGVVEIVCNHWDDALSFESHSAGDYADQLEFADRAAEVLRQPLSAEDAYAAILDLDDQY